VSIQKAKEILQKRTLLISEAIESDKYFGERRIQRYDKIKKISDYCCKQYVNMVLEKLITI